MVGVSAGGARFRRNLVAVICFTTFVILICLYHINPGANGIDNKKLDFNIPEQTTINPISKDTPEWLGYNEDIRYIKNISLIVVGGMPRSGTTLMRAILDTHGDVSCGREVFYFFD
jgi:hypothetical protein